jgi:hypothetical protein
LAKLSHQSHETVPSRSILSQCPTCPVPSSRRRPVRALESRRWGGGSTTLVGQLPIETPIETKCPDPPVNLFPCPIPSFPLAQSSGRGRDEGCVSFCPVSRPNPQPQRGEILKPRSERSAGLGSRRPPFMSSKAPSGRDKFASARTGSPVNKTAHASLVACKTPSFSLPAKPRRAEPVFLGPCKQLEKFPAPPMASVRWQLLPPFLAFRRLGPRHPRAPVVVAGQETR